MSIKVERRDNGFIVTIHRPEVGNAVDRSTAKKLADAFRAFDADDPLSVAILPGAGGNFCPRGGLEGGSRGAGKPGGALEGALVVARTIAAFPQRCMRSDRMSVYEQWGLDWNAATRNEFRRGSEVVASGETLSGASRFAGGEGRHGG